MTSKQPLRGTKIDLTPAQIDDLVGGHTLAGIPRKQLWKSGDERKQAWFKHRDFFMQHQGKGIVPGGELFAFFDFGERPHAWWCYKSKEPRRVVDPKDPNLYEITNSELYYGEPRHYEIAEGHTAQVLPEYESQFEYLERLGLLFKGEKDAYQRKNWVELKHRKAASKLSEEYDD